MDLLLNHDGQLDPQQRELPGVDAGMHRQSHGSVQSGAFEKNPSLGTFGMFERNSLHEEGAQLNERGGGGCIGTPDFGRSRLLVTLEQ